MQHYCMKHKRLVGCLSALVFILVLLIISPTQTNASVISINPGSGIDAVLVIDTSGSMRFADPERIALEAATLFMGMMETRNSRIAIVPFSGSLHSVMPLTPIDDPNIRSNIRSSVSRFQYHGFTDIGLGLRAAAEMLLEDPIETNSPVILLFTDGQIELSPQSERSEEESFLDTWWAVDNVGSFTPIYTIGLNYDGSVNTEFLEYIAHRTNATSHVIEDPSLLPLVFNEIFASHMRTSIDVVQEFIADGQYTNVPINIDSHFVAEANIIMLSSQPLENVQLFNPLGEEVTFDGTSYTLTSANRYSIVKIINPMAGEWLLRVRGVPEDNITVNLIYNYTIDIAFSVSQPAMTGMLFDPDIPLTVNAILVSQMPQSQTQLLAEEATAFLHAYDMDGNHLGAIEMDLDGSIFTVNFMPEPPQDVRIQINVTHPSFEVTTSTATVPFDIREVEPSDNEEPSLVDEPPQDDPVEYDPIVNDIEEPEEESESRSIVLIIILIIVAILLVMVAIVLLRSVKDKRMIFTGYLELRALLSNGKYTSLEAPDLHTFAGRISLAEFIKVSLGARAERVLEAQVPLSGVYIQPTKVNNRPRLLLTTNGNCLISDRDGYAVSQRKFLWDRDEQLVFSLADGATQIEITYRIDEK